MPISPFPKTRLLKLVDLIRVFYQYGNPDINQKLFAIQRWSAQDAFYLEAKEIDQLIKQNFPPKQIGKLEKCLGTLPHFQLIPQSNLRSEIQSEESKQRRKIFNKYYGDYNAPTSYDVIPWGPDWTRGSRKSRNGERQC